MEEYLSYDSVAYEKKRKLSSLLGLINIPTRKSLIQEVVCKFVFIMLLAQLNSIFQSCICLS